MPTWYREKGTEKKVQIFKTGKVFFLIFFFFFFFFSEILTYTTVLGLIEDGLLFQGKMSVCGWNLPYFEVNGIYRYHSSDVPTVPRFWFITKVTANFLWKNCI